MVRSLACAAAIALAASTLALGADWHAQVAPAEKRIALTFDDLPAHGPLPPGVTRTDIVRQIVRALRDRQSPPVYGFINAKLLEGAPRDAEVLRIWRDGGFP